MQRINLKIAILRKARGLTQQGLADALGVSFQTVSKWENQVTMPDITMLPALAELFGVSVDELLGLKPLAEEAYLSKGTDGPDYWEKREAWLQQTGEAFWNEDYLRFLLERVWKIGHPVSVLDCGCGFGALGLAMLPLLPEGSTYTGIDFSGTLLEAGRRLFAGAGLNGRFIEGDFYAYPVKRTYDLVVCKSVLRHVKDAAGFLERMVRHAKPGGLVACIEVNRELECGGLYVEGMDYLELCAHEGLKKLWACEKKEEGRDFAAAIKAAQIMEGLGLKEIGVRLNDRVHFVSPQTKGYERQVRDFMAGCGWMEVGGNKTAMSRDEVSREEKCGDEISRAFPDPEGKEPQIRALMSRGMDRKEADEFLERDERLARFFAQNRDTVSFTRLQGAIITFGRKEEAL